MLTSQQNSPVSEIERNVKRDQRLLLIVLFLNFFNIGNMIRRHPHALAVGTQTTLWVLLAGMILFMGWYFHRLGRAVGQLRRTDIPTYGHIQSTIQQMRVLMRSRLNVVLIFVGLVGLTALYGRHEFILRDFQAGRIDWVMTGLLLLGIAAVLAVTVLVGKQKQQRRYGQHLDRLEAVLRELQEPG